MQLIDMFRRFVSFQKVCDKEAGEELLKQFESLPVKETREFGFALPETAMILQVMVDHKKRLKEIDEMLQAELESMLDGSVSIGGAGGI